MVGIVGTLPPFKKEEGRWGWGWLANFTEILFSPSLGGCLYIEAGEDLCCTSLVLVASCLSRQVEITVA